MFSFARHIVTVRDAEFMVSGQRIRNADAVSVDGHPWFHESVPAVSASLIAPAFGVLCVTIATFALPHDANLFFRRMFRGLLHTLLHSPPVFSCSDHQSSGARESHLQSDPIRLLNICGNQGCSEHVHPESSSNWCTEHCWSPCCPFIPCFPKRGGGGNPVSDGRRLWQRDDSVHDG